MNVKNKRLNFFKQIGMFMLCTVLLIFNPGLGANYNAGILDVHITPLNEIQVSSWTELVAAVNARYDKIYITSDIRRGVGDALILIRHSVELISAKPFGEPVTISSDVVDQPLITVWYHTNEYTLTFTNIILDGEDRVPIGLYLYGTNVASKVKTGNNGTLEITGFNNDGSWAPSTPWNTTYIANSGNGAAIYSSLTNLNISIDGKIHNNKAVNGAAVYYRNGMSSSLSSNGGKLSIENNEATGKNGVGGNGGAIAYMQQILTIDSFINITIKDIYIHDNISRNGKGGAIYVDRASVELENVSISNNSADFGGAIYANSLGNAGVMMDSNKIFATILINDGTVISGNNAVDGGGIYIEGSRTGREYSLRLNNGLIAENEAKRNGGGIYLRTIQDASRRLAISSDSGDSLLFIMDGDSNIQRNRAENGGGIYLTSDQFTLQNSDTQHGTIFRILSGVIEGNEAEENGGGIYVDNSNTTGINNITGDRNRNSRQKIELGDNGIIEIKNNIAGKNGGGLFVNYFPTLTFDRYNNNYASISLSGNKAPEFLDVYNNFPSLQNIYSSVIGLNSQGVSYFNSYSRHDILGIDFKNALNNFDIGTQYFRNNNDLYQNPNKILYSGGMAGDEILPERLTIPIYFEKWHAQLPLNFDVELTVAKDTELTLENYNFLYWAAYFGNEYKDNYQSGDIFILNLDRNNHPRADVNFIAQWERKKGSYEIIIWDIIRNMHVPNIEVTLVPQFNIEYEQTDDYILNKETDDNGRVLFEKIPTGEYIVEVNIPNNIIYDYIEIEENLTNSKVFLIEYHDSSVGIDSGRIEVYVSDQDDENMPIGNSQVTLYKSEGSTLINLESSITNEYGFAYFDITDVDAEYYIIQNTVPEEYNLNQTHFGAIIFPDENGNYLKRINITNESAKHAGKEYVFYILAHVENIPQALNNEISIHDNGVISGLDIIFKNNQTGNVRAVTTGEKLIDYYNASISLPAGEYTLMVENIPEGYESLSFNNLVVIPDNTKIELIFKEKQPIVEFGELLVNVVTLYTRSITTTTGSALATTTGSVLATTTGSALLIEDNDIIPLEGATVIVNGDVYYTNQDGFVLIPNLPFGTYDIWAYKEGYYHNIENTEISMEQPASNVIMKLTWSGIDEAAATIEGAVLDITTGKGISSAIVILDEQIVVDTNESGYYAIKGVTPGKYTILVSANGFYDYKVNIDVHDDEFIIQNFMLTPIPNHSVSTNPSFPIHIKREEELQEEIITPSDEDIISNYEEIYYNYIIGYQGLVRPDESITRAEVAVILYRLFNNGDIFLTQSFKDVENNLWYSQAVNFLSEKGVLLGYEDGTFRPQNEITRAEFAVILTRLNTARAYFHNPFSDITNHWAYEYIIAAAHSGLVKGYPDGTFLPNNIISRAEVINMINRLLGRSITIEQLPDNFTSPFYDIKAEHWAYADIIAAAVKHKYDKASNKIITLD